MAQTKDSSVPQTRPASDEARLAALETESAATRSVLSELSRELRSGLQDMRESFEKQQSAHRAEMDAQRDRQKAPVWQIVTAILSTVGILLVVGGMVQTGNNDTDVRLENALIAMTETTTQQLDDIDETIRAHYIDPGAHGLDRAEESLKGLIERQDADRKELDTNLQREMRDLDARMQGEFGAQLDSIRTDIRRMQEADLLIADDRFRGSDATREFGKAESERDALDDRVRALEIATGTGP